MNNIRVCRLFTAVCPRYVHTGLVMCSLTKQSRIMNKLMNVKAKAKRKWYEPPENTLPTIKNLSKTSKQIGKSGSKRVAVLNKLFMKNITDLLCTGSTAREVLGHGLEISKVDIATDFQILNVYWVCGSEEHNHAMETLLNRTAGTLRHELSQLRLMGEVPTIMFVKDEHAARLQDLDERLSRADYGEDYEPKSLGHILKSDFTLETKLPSAIKEQIEQLESQLDEDEETIPEMTYTVYGLDQLTITNRLRGARKRNEDAWGRLASATPEEQHEVVSYRAHDSPRATYDFDEQKKNLAEFLQKRQIEQDKQYKMLRNKNDERNIVFEVERKQSEEFYEEDMEDVFYDEEDLENDSSSPVR